MLSFAGIDYRNQPKFLQQVQGAVYCGFVNRFCDFLNMDKDFFCSGRFFEMVHDFQHNFALGGESVAFFSLIHQGTIARMP